MDLELSAGAAVLETAAFVPLGKLASRATLTTWVAFFALSFVALKVYRIFIYPFYVSPLRHLPGPKNNTFFLGQLVNQSKTPAPNAEPISWMRQWPDAPFIRYLSFGNSEVLMVNSIAAQKEVMQTKCYSFAKPGFFKGVIGPIVGDGLLFALGDQHKKQRRLLAGPYSAPNIRKLYPIFVAKANELLKLFDQAIEQDPQRQLGAVDATSTFAKVMLDIIGPTVLGVELNNLSSGSAPGLAAEAAEFNFQECYHRVVNPPTAGMIIAVLNAFVPLRWLPLGENRRFKEANAYIWDTTRRLIRQRMIDVVARSKSGEDDGSSGASSQSGSEKKKKDKAATQDLLTFMAEATVSGDVQWTDTEILEHVLQALAAGHETTATALEWASYALAKHGDVQDRLRAEIAETLQAKGELDATAIESMHYLNNFVRETLRVYPPSLNIPREASEDMVIEGVSIPKGTSIILVPEVIHTNPRIWGEDAVEFDPDRWDHLAGDAASVYALASMSNGPRICIGKSFAMLMLKTVLVEMVRSFAIEDAATVTQYENPSITLKAKGGLHIKVRRVRE